MIATKKEQKYKYVVPEGGFGYVVALGKVMVFVSVAGLHSSGLIINDFLKTINISNSIIAILGSCSSGCMSLAGLLSSTLIERFSRRSVGVVAAILYFLGSGFQIFGNSVLHLFLNSAIHGVAFGLIIPIIFATFNEYFVERRAFVTAISQTAMGVAHMIAPLIVKYLNDEYGFRGCIAVLTAISAHLIFGMLVMHPVEWHMKKVPIVEEEKKEEVVIENGKLNGNAINEKIKDETFPQLKPLMAEHKNDSRMQSVISLRHLTKLQGSTFHSRRTSMGSVGFAGSLMISEVLDPPPKTTGRWKSIVNFLDLSLLNNFSCVNIIVGMSLASYADFSFFGFLPMYLYELDYEQSDVAVILSIGSGSDLVSRFVLILITGIVDIPPKAIYLTGVATSLVARYMFFYATDFWSMAILAGSIGFLKTWIHVPMGLIFAGFLPKERLASGYGLLMFIQGMFMLAIGPVARYFREVTNTYTPVFHLLNCLLIINFIAWTSEIIWRRLVKNTPKPVI